MGRAARTGQNALIHALTQRCLWCILRAVGIIISLCSLSVLCLTVARQRLDPTSGQGLQGIPKLCHSGEDKREAYEHCALQMEGMEQTQSTDHDAMYANGYPEVGLDQDASVHLNDVRSHIAALKVHIS